MVSTLSSVTHASLQRASAWRAGVVLVPLLLVLGGLSARIAGSTEDNAWYQTLTLPALQPPGPVFGIAWSLLYTLIAVSAAIIWAHKRAPGRKLALVLFGIGICERMRCPTAHDGGTAHPCHRSPGRRRAGGCP